MKKVTFLFFILILSLSFNSCVTNKRYNLLQGATTEKNSNPPQYEVTLQPDDELMIIISSFNPELAAPYNLSVGGVGGGATYLIDQNGYIVLPNLGSIKAAGKTRNQLIEAIKEALKGKLENPTIYVKLMNFRVLVYGEVAATGMQTVKSERYTILEALTNAGITYFGKRKKVLIIRENNGTRTFETVDVTKADLINSPYFYLAQNDVIYVEPNFVKLNSTVITPTVGFFLSGISVGLTILLLTRQ